MEIAGIAGDWYWLEADPSQGVPSPPLISCDFKFASPTSVLATGSLTTFDVYGSGYASAGIGNYVIQDVSGTQTTISPPDDPLGNFPIVFTDNVVSVTWFFGAGVYKDSQAVDAYVSWQITSFGSSQ